MVDEVGVLEGRDVSEKADAEVDFEAEGDSVDDRELVVVRVDVGDVDMVRVDRDVKVSLGDDVGVLDRGDVRVDI